MRLWRARVSCVPFNFELKAGQLIGLEDEHEQKLKLGKYAESRPDKKALRADPKSKKTITITYPHLELMKGKEVDETIGLNDEGMVIYPPPPTGFRLVSQAGAGAGG